MTIRVIVANQKLTQDTESTYTNRQLLFSADQEGEEDAEEFRSIRSSKIGYDSETDGRGSSASTVGLPDGENSMASVR